MPAADAGQHLVRKGLGVDGDAGRPILLDDGQLFGVGAVGAACLHRVFHDAGKVKALPHGAHQLAELVCRKAGGRAAADVDAAQLQPGLLCLRPDLLHLAAEAVHIGLHQLAVPVEIAADEAAIAAPGGAERDADVQAVGLRLAAQAQDRLLQIGNGSGHLVFLLRAVEPAQEKAVDLRFAPTGGALVVDESDRAHTGHLAPGRADARPAAQQVIGQAGKSKGFGFAVRPRQRGGDGLLSAVLPHQRQQTVRLPLGPHTVLPGFGRGQGERCHWVKQPDQMLDLVAGCKPCDINLHVFLPFYAFRSAALI